MTRKIESQCDRITEEDNFARCKNLMSEGKLDMERAVRFHSDIENDCDILILEQDELIRSIVHRAKSRTRVGSPGLLQEKSTGSEKLPANAHGVDSAGRPSKLAPMLNYDFSAASTDAELANIASLEAEIRAHHLRMIEVEKWIERSMPLSLNDKLIKMKFFAGLIIDGGTIDIESFAWLVDDVTMNLKETAAAWQVH